MVEASLDANPDLLVINRFGKSKIEGGGLRPVLAAALLRAIPVLTAVREMNLADWRAFHQGAAQDLPPLPQAVRNWVNTWREARNGLHAA